LGEEKKVEMNLPGNPDFGRMIGKKQKSTRKNQSLRAFSYKKT